MVRWLAGFALLLTVLFALLLGVFRIPSLQRTPPVQLDSCAAPCWEGIQPGITAPADAVDRLTRASGVEPSLAPCYNASNPLACDLYQWKLPDEVAIRTGMQVQHETIQMITAQSPGLTLGEALLMLRDLRQPLYEIQIGYSIDTLSLSLGFSNSSVRLSAITTCPTTYRDLMHAPVARLVLQEAEATRQHIPATFSIVRQTIYSLCER